MTDKPNAKIILRDLIPPIIDNKENLKSFVFFLNRLENIRRPTDEIQSVLNDYLYICKDLPVKGKKKVKHIDDRHLLYCEENIGFIDADKIEIIANAILNKSGVKLPISIHDFKRRYKKKILRNDEWGKRYKDLMKEYQKGDEIIEFISPRWTWKQLCGRSGVVLVRDGETVAGIAKTMN